ncbi:MAG: hypothetical protein QNK04_23765 [Myxococcota bacterium]|nr:hypothetical protein [Myxococcota bacterium]
MTAEQERQRLESRFQQTQRLESLGVLAGGIGHDFNNLLVGILGHADLSRGSLLAGSPARRHIGAIEKVARRAADLCRQMLSSAGQGSLEPEPLDLRETVEGPRLGREVLFRPRYLRLPRAARGRRGGPRCARRGGP